MTFAFGHLIAAWLAGKGYEYFKGKKLGQYTWFFLLLGGILPDVDYLLDWTIGTQIHRTFTHSIFFALIATLVVLYFSLRLKHQERRYFALALGGGILVHLFVDFFSRQGIPLFWPNLTYVSFPLVNYIVVEMKLAILDMALGTIWIFYLLIKGKIKF